MAKTMNKIVSKSKDPAEAITKTFAILPEEDQKNFYLKMIQKLQQANENNGEKGENIDGTINEES